MKRSFPWKVFLLSLLPIVFWLYYLNRFVVQNIPQMDDLTYSIEFMRPFEAAPTLWEKLQVLFEQHFVTEHRVPLPKLLIYLQYLLTGQIDYAVMSWYGNLIAVPGLLILAARVIQRSGWSAWTFLPLPYLFFQIQYYEVITWSNCALLYIFSTFLAWATLYFAAFPDGKRRRFVLALVLSVLCLLNFGNGMFVYLPFGALLVYQQRYRDLFVTIGLAVVCVGLYFIGYHSAYSSAVKPAVVLSFLTLLGAYLEPLWRLHPGAQLLIWLVGVGILGAFAAALTYLLRTWRLPNGRTLVAATAAERPGVPFLAGGLLFLLMTGAAVALKRSSVSELEMFVSRYRYISIFSVAAAYLIGVAFSRLTAQRRWAQGAALAMAGVSVLSYYSYHVPVQNIQEAYRIGAYNYQRHGNWHFFAPGNDWYAYVNNATEHLVASGRYRFPDQFYTNQSLGTPTADTLVPAPAEAQLRVLRETGMISLFNDGFRPTQESTPTRGTCLLLQSATHTFLVPIQRQPNRGRKELLRTGRMVGQGFAARLLAGVYPAGRYQLSILHRDGGALTRIPTGTTVEL
jgi:hypothetical protein